MLRYQSKRIKSKKYVENYVIMGIYSCKGSINKQDIQRK